MNSLRGSRLPCRCLILAITLLVAGRAAAEPPSARTPWPVSVAADGFSAAQAEQVLRDFAPMKLAGSGDQALYTYLNMAAFFPHHLIARGASERTLPVAVRGAIGDLRVGTDLGELSLTDLLADPRSRIQGLLVLHRGQVVFESYPGMRASDSHLWWSVAKVIAGLLTEMLIEEGRIAPERDIVSYLPEFSGSGWDGVSVDDVLDMASGIAALDSAEDYVDPASEIGRLIYAEGVLSRPGHTPTGHDEALKAMTAAAPPGRYAYSSANTNMLGLLIERVTGQRYADVVQTRIWSRIGAEGDALLGLSPDGRAIAHGMFSSRLRDLGRFGLVFTSRGSDVLQLPARLQQRLRDTGGSERYRKAAAVADRMAQQMGARPVAAPAQWDALFADGDLFKSGFDGQVLYVSPQREVVIAMYSTSRNRRAYAYLRAIAGAFAPSAEASAVP